jgi:sugar/nucleoside kinase (ribokinase family)
MNLRNSERGTGNREQRCWDVVGIGENSIDYVYRLPALPTSTAAATKIPIADHQILPGGQVATTLATCAALGLTTSYAGAIGNDENGRRIRGELESRGVDTNAAIIRPASSRYAVILVDESNGERIILWDRDRGLNLSRDEIPASVIRSARVLHVDNVDEEAAIGAARVARDAGVPITSDIDHVTDRTEPLLQLVTIPILSESVPRQLTGEADPERALRALRRRHDGWLCVTLGDQGSMLLEGDRLHYMPAFTVTAVDTTGAGDVFRGAFIYAWLHRHEAARILRFANAAAAISCTREGALGGVPTLDEIDYFLKRTNPNGGTTTVSE